MKKEGVRAGVPDILLCAAHGGYFGMAIEMKRQDMTMKAVGKKQSDWIEKFKSRNWYTKICFGRDIAIKVLEWYINQPPTKTLL